MAGCRSAGGLLSSERIPFGHPMLMLLFLPLQQSMLLVLAAEADGELEGSNKQGAHDEEESEPPFAVLFPWFVQAIGVFIFFSTTRTFETIPYTAKMFLIGAFMGIGAARLDNIDQLTTSMTMWADINGEVILLVFLPGLLFWDALDVNFHLFTASINQLLIMAFPMVLAGATLTACVGYYVFPYEWSFMLSMTFGSILAATDPVAVSALLNEVGAPPRLKMHISGESMLNDGSAVVFYSVFSAIFLHELDIGLGRTFTVGEGFAIFFRMSLGGTAVGLAFGLGLIALLYYLNRRLDMEENIIQVAATITAAYLSFYTAEMVCHMSGVISVVICGITTRAFGGGMINDPHMMMSFWHLVEHLLNTLLFALGGLVWGGIIANSDERTRFSGTDWGYLILLYVLVQAIRFFLVFAFYPLLSRIGINSNWQESFFLSYGGLRGAVGIALSVSLDNEVFQATTPENIEARDYTTKLFGMVGGVAFLTLLLNGTFAGPILRKLGLAKPTETRVRVVERYERRIREHLLDLFVHLLTDPRFREVDFAVICHHVHTIKDLTLDELKFAVARNKASVPPRQYKAPNLKNVLPYLESTDTSWAEKIEEDTTTATTISDATTAELSIADEDDDRGMKSEKLIKELRFAFLDLVQAAYVTQVEKGELSSREGDGFLVHSLEESIDIAADAVNRGKPLLDWEASQLVSTEWTDKIEIRAKRLLCSHRKRYRDDPRAFSPEYRLMRIEIYKALAFIQAHRSAQELFQYELLQDENSDVFIPAKTVMLESEAQVALAEEDLRTKDRQDVKVTISHLFCIVLLNKVARHTEKLRATGLLKEKEARKDIETIEHALHGIEFCSHRMHPGERIDKEGDATEKHVSRMLAEMKSRSRRIQPMDNSPHTHV